MAPGLRVLTTKEGRRLLPTSRPKTRAPQPRAASAARDPIGSGAIAQSKAESLPAPQSAAMMRQTSTPYINSTAPLPYRNEADAKKDLEDTITAVNRGRYSSNSDVKDEPIQQLPGAGDLSRPGQATIFIGRDLSSQEREAVMALVAMSQTIQVNDQPRPASSETQPKRKRDEDGGKKEKKSKKAKQEKEKNHICDECGRAFTRNEHLVRHVKAVHGTVREKYLCDLCDKWMSRKDNLSQHRRLVHPGAGPVPVLKSVFAIVDENGNKTGIAKTAELVDSRAQSDCEETSSSESSSGHVPKRGRSTSTNSGSFPPQTTTETGGQN